MRTNFFPVVVATVQVLSLYGQADRDAVRSIAGSLPRNYLNLPLAFEQQDGARETFLARGHGYAVSLHRGDARIGVLLRQGEPLPITLEFAGARAVSALPGPELPAKINYIEGSDRRQWRMGLTTWARVRYPNIYPGIDVVYYGNQQQLEFDLVLKPGANPGAIRMKVTGGAKLRLDSDGALEVDILGSDPLRFEVPKIYQQLGEMKRSISGRYLIVRANEVGFDVDTYDRTRPLIIDPTITYSKLLGSGESTVGKTIAVDPSGNVLIAGYTVASDLSTRTDAYPSGHPGRVVGFVTKTNAAGTALIYSAYLGGSDNSYFNHVAVDSFGNAWVTGYTYASDFPTLNAIQSARAGDSDAIVVKLSPTGVLQFASYLGGAGNDSGSGIAVDAYDNAYLTGYTEGGFPTTAAAAVPPLSSDKAFVIKVSPTGSLQYSTLLGGSGYDSGTAVAVDQSGNAYVTGYSYSTAFAAAPLGGAQPTNHGTGDAFVAKLDPTGNKLVYFTFIGGNGFDAGEAIAVDLSGNAYIGGRTSSMTLATPNAAQPSLKGATNGFVAKLNAAGSNIEYFTYLGGSRQDFVYGLDIDAAGAVYVVGSSTSADLPTVSATPAVPRRPAIQLLHSTNSGESWSSLRTGISDPLADISINSSNSSTVALAQSGVYRSAENGGSWTLQFAGIFSSDSASLSRSSTAPAILYATDGTALYQSLDDGVTWKGQGKTPLQILGIMADPLAGDTVYAFGSTAPYIIKSTDGGVTWSAAGSGLPAAPVWAMTATSDGTLYAGTPGHGIYRSNNQGVSWTAANTGLPQTRVSRHSLSASGATVYFADGSIYMSSDGGHNWAKKGDHIGALTVTASAHNPSVIYVVTTSGNVQVSADGGSTWDRSVAALLPGPSSSCARIVVDAVNTAQSFIIPCVYPRAFVSKLNTTGSSLSWSTYLGSDIASGAYGVAATGEGLVVAGYTTEEEVLPDSSALRTNTFRALLTSLSDGVSNTSRDGVSPSVKPSLTVAALKSNLPEIGTPVQASQSTALQLVTVTPCRVMDTRNANGPLGGPFIAGNTSRTIPIPLSSCNIPPSAVAYSLNVTVVPRAGTLGFLTVWPTGVSQPLVSTLNSLDGSILANAAIVPAGTNGSINAYATNDTDLIIDINGYFVPPATGTLQFYPLTPCRVLDTRNTAGAFGGPSLAAGGSRSFAIPSSSCGVPGVAAAYSFNVTVVPHGSLGFVTAWPTGQSQPLVSTLNSLDGTILANAAIVPAGANGSVSFYASDPTDLVVDIDGYFAAPASGGLNFFPLTPCRVVDTRNSTGALGGPVMTGNTSRTFPLPQGSCGLPLSASAYSVNVTVAPSVPLGFLTMWPTGANQPLVSTLNALDGQIVANAALVPAGTGGAANVYVTNTTHVIIDTNGYFTSGTTSPLSFVTTSPLPGGSTGIAYNTQVIATGGATPYHWTVTGLPPGLNFDSTGVSCGNSAPSICGTPTTAGISSVLISVTDSSTSPQTISNTFSLTITVPAGAITVSSATVGANLEDQLTITFNPALPADTTLTITSGNPGAVLIGNSGTLGKAQLQTTIPVGTSTVTIYAQALTNSGTVTITASAPGYTSGAGTITLANSAFVLSAGSNGIGSSFTTYENVVTGITIYAARVDNNGVFVESQSVAGGQSFNISLGASPSNLGTFATNPVPFPGGTSSVVVNFTANPTTMLTGSITVTQPTGYVNPLVGGSLGVSIQQTGLIAPTVTVGNNLQTPATITLNAPAAALTSITLTSSDSTKLAFSNDPADATRRSTINITIPQNQTTSTTFYVRGYASSGSVSYTISSGSYGTITANVQLGPSGLAISFGLLGGLGGSFTESLTGPDATLYIWSALVDNTGTPLALQPVAADMSISAAVTSGTPGVGTITSSPVVISGGADNGTTTFHPLTTGSSTITASATGYSSGTIKANVQGCTVNTNNNLTIGQFGEAQASLVLSCAAGTGGVSVTLTSNSNNVKLAVNPTDAGSSSITVPVAAGATTASYWVYSLASSGSGTYGASAAGYTSGSPDTVTFAPSGVIILQTTNANPPTAVCFGTCPVPLANGAVSVTVMAYQLSTDGSNTLVGPQALMGNGSVVVPLGNTNAGAGTLSTSSPTIAAGSYYATFTFTPKATGSATISVSQPTGFATPGLFQNTNVTQIIMNVQ